MSSRASSAARFDRPDDRAVPLIAHVIYRLHTGGMENGVVNLINGLPGDRYRHALICITASTAFAERLRRNDVSIHALHKRPGKDPRVYLRFWKLVRALRPAIVHTRNLGALDFAPLAALAGVPIRIHGEHGWDAGDAHGMNRKYRLLRKCCNPAITRYVAVSQDIRRWLNRTIGISSDKVQHLCNGVDVGLFRPDGPTAELYAGHRDEQILTIGSVGRFDPIKGFDTLVAAVGELVRNDQSIRRRMRLVIVGDGPMYSAIARQVRELGLDDAVILTGERKDIPDVLRSFDLFVLASRNEGISNTVLEAMATGLPVIATNVGGNPELIEERSTGYLVPPDAPGEIAAAIRHYITNDDLRRNHGHAARKRAEERFSLNAMVSGYRRLYDRFLYNQNQ